MTGDPPSPRRGTTIAVVGAGAANVKSTVALNLALALVARRGGAAPSVALVDLDGASSRALGVVPPGVAAVPWLDQPLAVRAAVGDGPDGGPGKATTVVVDPPPRLDATTRAVLVAADVVLVPVDASPLALRVLGDVARVVAAADGARAPAVRVVLARRLPRDADRWGLVEQVDALAPGALLAATLPMAPPRAARAASTRPAVLYAPGTAAARAYAALARELDDAGSGAGVSTSA